MDFVYISYSLTGYTLCCCILVHEKFLVVHTISLIIESFFSFICSWNKNEKKVQPKRENSVDERSTWKLQMFLWTWIAKYSKVAYVYQLPHSYLYGKKCKQKWLSSTFSFLFHFHLSKHSPLALDIICWALYELRVKWLMNNSLNQNGHTFLFPFFYVELIIISISSFFMRLV